MLQHVLLYALLYVTTVLLLTVLILFRENTTKDYLSCRRLTRNMLFPARVPTSVLLSYRQIFSKARTFFFGH